MRVPLLGEHNTSTADVKEYLDGMKDIFSPTQQAYLFKVKFNKYDFMQFCSWTSVVRDTNRLSCEPRGIPQKELQIACVAAIYANDVIYKLA